MNRVPDANGPDAAAHRPRREPRCRRAGRHPPRALASALWRPISASPSADELALLQSTWATDVTLAVLAADGAQATLRNDYLVFRRSFRRIPTLRTSASALQHFSTSARQHVSTSTRPHVRTSTPPPVHRTRHHRPGVCPTSGWDEGAGFGGGTPTHARAEWSNIRLFVGSRSASSSRCRPLRFLL